MINTEDLTLDERIERMELVADEIKALHNTLSFLGVGNIPFDPEETIDTYDKDAAQGLAILCELNRAEKIARYRVNELMCERERVL